MRPMVGVGAIIIKDNKILLCKRKGAHGENEWGTCGGHLEYGESIEGCAKREAREELGIEIDNLKFLCLSNITKYDKHYVDIEFLADIKNGSPKIKENFIEEILWFPLDQLPSPLFEPVRLAIESFNTGRVFNP
jgi:8-oxo-dGTP diphosphatase